MDPVNFTFNMAVLCNESMPDVASVHAHYQSQLMTNLWFFGIGGFLVGFLVGFALTFWFVKRSTS